MPNHTDIVDPEVVSQLSVQTLPALLDFAAKSFAAHVAMKSQYPWGFQSITFSEFDSLYASLGTGLTARGLGRGERVALIAENSPEWAMVYAAVTSCGATIVPLDTQIKENEIRHLLMHSEARYLVTSQRILRERIESMHLEEIDIIVIGEDESKEDTTTLAEIVSLGKEKINSGEQEFFRRRASITPEDTAAVCYTSGTTGTPKGAVLLHRNIVSNVEACKLRIPFRQGDVFLNLLPLHHTFSTTCNLLAPLYGGCTIVYGRSMKSRDIREDIQREEVTILVGVPLLFEHMVAAMRRRLQDAPKAKRLLARFLKGLAAGLSRLLRRNVSRAIFKKQLTASGLGSLKLLISGAAALRPDVEEVLFALGLPILQGYGMTEASPVIAVNPLEKTRHGTVGTAIPGVEVRIDSPDESGIGEIIVRGPNVMKEYFKNSEATADVLRDGWLYTGDLGHMDSEGYITIHGRKKSVIVTAGGKNVFPDELEILLNESPFILESVVLPIQDSYGNPRIAAVIVPDYDVLGTSPELKERLTEENIRAVLTAEIEKVNAEVSNFKRIVEFQFRDEELPKTTTRKVKRHLVTWITE
ncbi:MAG: AMP-binding protein [bacterium]|nr:MAG: AMP-binding protein [bacterium]